MKTKEKLRQLIDLLANDRKIQAKDIESRLSKELNNIVEEFANES